MPTHATSELSGRWGQQHTSLVEPVAPGPTLADVVAERDYERRRANEAIAQLHDVRRELAALRGHAPDAGEVTG